MTTMKLFLSPVDVWLFRDGRPFDAGADHYARSLFPPYPSVVQGAIRARHLIVQGVNLGDKRAIAEAVGTAENFGSLRLRGPFITRREDGRSLTRYFPAPADAAPWDDSHLKAITPQPAADRKVITSADGRLPLLLFPHPIEAGKREWGGWLTEALLWRCLQGEPVQPIYADALFAVENRYGIGMDSDRRAAQRGQLYAAEFIRPHEGVGLYVEVNGYDGWPERGLMRIGGEGRAAHFERVDAPDWPAPPQPLPTRFKLYFATPAYFSQGWQPADWRAFFEGDVTLKAVALNRYESRGGFDDATGDQKSARRFVPAGSVYFFEHNGSARLRSDLVQNAITDYGAEIGFGQVAVASW